MSDELRDQITNILDEYSIHAAVSLDYIAELIVDKLAESPAQNVRVKPLEWEGDAAYSAIGQYRIMKTRNRDNDKYMVTYLDPYRKSHTLGYIEGRSAAKAAAQADYETRIMAALETADPLTDPRVVAMVEALRLADAALDGADVNMSVVKRKVNAALTDALAHYKAQFIAMIEDDT